MLWEILTTTRDLGRLHDIGSVLIRHGFGDLVRRLGLARALETAGRYLRWKQASDLARLEPAQRLRHVLEELGPTFVKLGQMLATRVDLFPPEWIVEFGKLQDQVPPLPWEELRPEIDKALGAPVDQVFRDVEREPLAAGSIAQTHRAKLADGTEIVLKVRRPGIGKIVESDLRLLGRLALLAESEIEEARRYRPAQILRQLERSLRNELDLSREGHNSERLAAAFPADWGLIVPKVFWQWTSESLNVQAYVRGIAGRDLEGARRENLDPKVLASLGARSVLKMVLEDGFFHADPHPGNFFLLAGNRLALVDFGMVGRLSASRRQQVTDLLFGLVDRDVEQVTEILADWGGDTSIDPESLSREIELFLDEYHGLSLKEIDFASMLGDMLQLLREHNLALPPDLSMLFKVLLTLEGFGRQLDPDFDLVGESRPFLERAIRARYSPQELARRGWRNLRRTLDLVTGLPNDLRSLLKSAKRGRLQLRIDLNDLRHFAHQLDQTANRMTVGVITAALIVGTAIVMTVQGGPTLFGLPIFGFLGFASSFAGGVWLLWSIWRSSKRR